MSLDSDIAVLSRVRLFEGFHSEQLRLLAFGCEARVLAKGTRLFKQGSFTEGGYVVVHGQVDLFSGPRNSIVKTYGASALLGEMALISETEHPATAVAAEDSEILKIPRPLFRRMLEEYPDLAILLQERISKSVNEFMTQLERISVKLDQAEQSLR